MNELEDLKKKDDKEKKKGFIGWLREKLGFTPRGMGNVSPGARNINLAGLRGAGSAGRFGVAGRFGSGAFGRAGSGGLLSFLGGKSGIITAALIALAVGTTLYYKNSSMGDVSQSASMGDIPIASYTPKILRDQQNASSLGMFDASGISLDEEEKNKNEEDVQKPVEEENNQQNTLDASLGFENKKRLQTDMKFGLSNAFGDGTNSKFSALGGFGNHTGKFGPSIKGDFSKTLSEANNLLKSAKGSKLSSMSAQKKPVLAKAGKFKNQKASTAYGQAKAIKGMQMQPNYGSADVARANLDKAWEGATGGGSVGLPSGGSGINDGGASVVQTPSTLDNINDPTLTMTPTNEVPSVPNYKFDTPWAALIQKAMMLMMIGALLAGIASMVAKIKPWGMILAIGLALAAAAMGVMVIMIGMKFMKEFGQQKLGMLYVIGGGLTIAAAIAAIAGVWISWAALLAKILAAGAGIIGMFASMSAAPNVKDMTKLNEEQKTQTDNLKKEEISQWNLFDDRYFG